MGVGLYNALLALISASLLMPDQRKQPKSVALRLIASLLGLGPILGLLFYQQEPLDPMFATMRMWSYGLFLQLPLLLGAWALLERRSQPRLAAGLGALSLTLALVGFDAFIWEPSQLQINKVEISSSKVKAPLTIAVLADIQSDDIGAYERAALEATVALAPDLILLPGDYVQAKDLAGYEDNMGRLNRMIKEVGLGAPLGAFAVPGNVDTIGTWPQIFAGTSVTTTTVSRSFALNPDLSITGLTLADSFNVDLKVEEQPGFHIVVGHAPDFSMGQVQADLMVAGHTHGGQVQLPFFGPLLTLSKVPRDWAHGLTALSEDRNLVVSRGVGLERGLAPRLRFNCRPELVLIRVLPQAE